MFVAQHSLWINIHSKAPSMDVCLSHYVCVFISNCSFDDIIPLDPFFVFIHFMFVCPHGWEGKLVVEWALVMRREWPLTPVWPSASPPLSPIYSHIQPRGKKNGLVSEYQTVNTKKQRPSKYSSTHLTDRSLDSILSLSALRFASVRLFSDNTKSSTLCLSVLNLCSLLAASSSCLAFNLSLSNNWCCRSRTILSDLRWTRRASWRFRISSSRRADFSSSFCWRREAERGPVVCRAVSRSVIRRPSSETCFSSATYFVFFWTRRW